MIQPQGDRGIGSTQGYRVDREYPGIQGRGDREYPGIQDRRIGSTQGYRVGG